MSTCLSSLYNAGQPQVTFDGIRKIISFSSIAYYLSYYYFDIVFKSNISKMSSCQGTISRASQTTPSRPSNRMSSTETGPDAQERSRTTSVDSDLSHYLYFEDNDSFFPPCELGEKPSPDGKDRSHGPYVDSSVQTWVVAFWRGPHCLWCLRSLCSDTY
jgi:hypothetical protein